MRWNCWANIHPKIKVLKNHQERKNEHGRCTTGSCWYCIYSGYWPISSYYKRLTCHTSLKETIVVRTTVRLRRRQRRWPKKNQEVPVEDAPKPVEMETKKTLVVGGSYGKYGHRRKKSIATSFSVSWGFFFGERAGQFFINKVSVTVKVVSISMLWLMLLLTMKFFL